MLYCVQHPLVSPEDCSLCQAVSFTLFSSCPPPSGISPCPETLLYPPLPLRTMTVPPSHNPGWPFLELPLHMHSKMQILIYIFWFVTQFSATEGLFIFNISFWCPNASNTVSGVRQHSTDGVVPSLSSLLPQPPPFLPSSPPFPLSLSPPLSFFSGIDKPR